MVRRIKSIPFNSNLVHSPTYTQDDVKAFGRRIAEETSFDLQAWQDEWLKAEEEIAKIEKDDLLRDLQQ